MSSGETAGLGFIFSSRFLSSAVALIGKNCSWISSTLMLSSGLFAADQISVKLCDVSKLELIPEPSRQSLLKIATCSLTFYLLFCFDLLSKLSCCHYD